MIVVGVVNVASIYTHIIINLLLCCVARKQLNQPLCCILPIVDSDLINLVCQLVA